MCSSVRSNYDRIILYSAFKYGLALTPELVCVLYSSLSASLGRSRAKSEPSHQSIFFHRSNPNWTGPGLALVWIGRPEIKNIPIVATQTVIIGVTWHASFISSISGKPNSSVCRRYLPWNRILQVVDLVAVREVTLAPCRCRQTYCEERTNFFDAWIKPHSKQNKLSLYVPQKASGAAFGFNVENSLTVNAAAVCQYCAERTENGRQEGRLSRWRNGAKIKISPRKNLAIFLY